MTILTLKIPELLARKLKAAARKRGVTKSALVREAVQRYLQTQLPGEQAPTAFDLVRDQVAVVKGPRDLSSNPEHLREYGA
jgi:hypothetical protein